MGAARRCLRGSRADGGKEEEEEVADEEESMEDNNEMENEDDADAENGGGWGVAGLDKGTKKRPKKKLKKVEILKSWRASKLVRRINIELTC